MPIQAASRIISSTMPTVTIAVRSGRMCSSSARASAFSASLPVAAASPAYCRARRTSPDSSMKRAFPSAPGGAAGGAFSPVCLFFLAIRAAHITPTPGDRGVRRMAQASEYIEFRRAFGWLLCGMLLPSVALVAFGVVAVANERAAVERRLAEDDAVRLRALEQEILAPRDRAP